MRAAVTRAFTAQERNARGSNETNGSDIIAIDPTEQGRESVEKAVLGRGLIARWTLLINWISLVFMALLVSAMIPPNAFTFFSFTPISHLSCHETSDSPISLSMCVSNVHLAEFHHDGPYDACNPYRNRKGVRAPPIQAFADESTAMSPAPLKRGDDTKEKFDYNLYHGHIEKSLDFANESLTPAGTYKPKKDDLTGFDPASRVEPVHGEESMGLGTSTFLEGAPASRAAIGTHERERRSSHDGGYADGWNSNSGGGAGGGLTRKKSLAQKIRGGITRGTSTREPPRPINHKVTTSSSSDELALPTVKTGKGPSVSFNDDELDRKGGSTQITALDKGNSDGPGSSSGPNRHNGNGGGNGGVGNGLLSRVKSLRKR